MVNRALVAALALLASCGAALAQAASSADFVNGLYGAQAPAGHYRHPLAVTDASLRERYLSQSLREAFSVMDRFTPAGDIPTLDFNVVSDSQSPDVTDLKIETESENDGDAVVIAGFKTQENPAPSVLRYELVREDGAWKINDVVSTGARRWRLREIIAAE